MADAHGMDIGYGSQQLISIQLYENRRNILLLLHVTLHDFVERIRDMLHNYIEVHLICCISIRVEVVLHLDTKWVPKDF